MTSGGSAGREDLLGADAVDAPNGAFSAQRSVGSDGVAGGPGGIAAGSLDGEPVDLGEADLSLVTVSFDPESDGDRLAELATGVGADGEMWRWATLAEDDVADVVGAGFRVFVDRDADGGFVFDPTFVIVDGWGVIRGEYQYATLASVADKLVRHIGVLGEEIRNSDRVTSIAYEAAHVFLCYP